MKYLDNKTGTDSPVYRAAVASPAWLNSSASFFRLI